MLNSAILKTDLIQYEISHPKVAKIQKQEEENRQFAQQFESHQAFRQGITRLNALQARERHRRRETSNMPFLGPQAHAGSDSDHEKGEEEASQNPATATSR